jgi:hypothetical protein
MSRQFLFVNIFLQLVYFSITNKHVYQVFVDIFIQDITNIGLQKQCNYNN